MYIYTFPHPQFTHFILIYLFAIIKSKRSEQFYEFINFRFIWNINKQVWEKGNKHTINSKIAFLPNNIYNIILNFLYFYRDLV